MKDYNNLPDINPIEATNNNDTKLNRAQRRALAKKNKKNNKKMHYDNMTEAIKELNYINMIEKLRILNEKQQGENNNENID